MKTTFSIAAVLALSSAGAFAQSETDDTPTWKGSGELGFVSSSGNTRSDSFNARLGMQFEDGDWKHQMHLAGFRQRNEVIVLADPNDPDSGERRRQLNANRYELGASTARKLNENNSLYAALRYENDDFAAYDYQATVSVGWGHQAIRSDRTDLYFEIGPGYRRIKDAVTGETEGEFIGRGKMNYEYRLGENASLVDTLLVEGGSDNTFLQNDLGVKVSMNDRFAIKAGLQIRHNTDVPVNRKKTDRLTTVNLVYDF